MRNGNSSQFNTRHRPHTRLNIFEQKPTKRSTQSTHTIILKLNVENVYHFVRTAAKGNYVWGEIKHTQKLTKNEQMPSCFHGIRSARVYFALKQYFIGLNAKTMLVKPFFEFFFWERFYYDF